MRQVDTPEVTTLVLLQRFEHYPARDPVRDTSLNHHLGRCMRYGAPHSAAQRYVAVAVASIGLASISKTVRGQHRFNFGEQAVDTPGFVAWPAGTEHRMHMLFPRLVGRVILIRTVSLPKFAGKGSAHPKRINSKGTHQANYFLLT